MCDNEVEERRSVCGKDSDNGSSKDRVPLQDPEDVDLALALMELYCATRCVDASCIILGEM